MKRNLCPLLAAAAILTLASCGGNDSPGGGTGGPTVPANANANNPTVSRKEVARLEFPHLKGGNSIVLVHKTSDGYDPDGVNYAVEWDTKLKSQRWTCYQMHRGYTGSAGYYGTFTEDPDLPSYARFPDTNYMYTGSGLTRGHICPSADRQYSREANIQTFYYSNMQPQYYNFNAGKNYTGVWVKMENIVRSWTGQLAATDTMYVCKGGTIDGSDNILMRIKGQLIVPKYFFMALLVKNSRGYKALGFWAEHNNDILPSVNLKDYVVSIAFLQQKTGIDFFCNLPDETENHVENLPRENILTAWGFK